MSENKLQSMRGKILELINWLQENNTPPAILFYELDQYRMERTFEAMYNFYEAQKKPTFAEQLGIDNA